jgi:hypothetical protein
MICGISSALYFVINQLIKWMIRSHDTRLYDHDDSHMTRQRFQFLLWSFSLSQVQCKYTVYNRHTVVPMVTIG